MGMDKTARQVEVRMVNVSPQNSKPRGCGVRRLVSYPESPIQRVLTCEKKAYGWESAEPIVGDSPSLKGLMYI